MPEVPLLVLAAGGSSRMGTPKQLLPWGQTTLLGHTLQTLMTFEKHPIYVVLGAYRNEVQAEINDLPVTPIHNTQWEKGMGVSIATGLKQVVANHPAAAAVLIALADQPLLDASYYSKLLEAHKVNPKANIVSGYSNGQQGVPAVFSNSFFDALLALNEDKGARHLIQKQKEQAVVITTGQLADVDTPAAYRDLFLKTFPTPQS